MVKQAKYELTEEIKNAILKYSTQYRLDPILVQAVIETESGYNPFAVRFEENYQWLYSDKELSEMIGMTRSTMRACQKMSVGLMQVMTSVCFELGFRGWPGHLYNVDLNVRYGCQHMRDIIDRKKLTKVDEIYDAYNAGKVDPNDGNQVNVMRFMKIYDNLKKN